MALRYGTLALLFISFGIRPIVGQGSGEWQQRIEYDIDVTLHTDTHQMEGEEVVRYYNNSPDTLRRVFFHLYFNAFHPESMMAARNRVLPDPDSRIVPRIFNLGPDEVGYHRIEAIRQNGAGVSFRITDTVTDVELAEPILPGESAVFELSFKSQVPLQTRRSGRDNREGIDYSMTQWYPKMAAYDERGWHADPYVGREFYAPFGTFDVRIKLPAEYTIGATGVLQNADEIGHGYTADSVAIASDSLTWHFRAENVHDFAWAADPDYVHDVLETVNGTTIHLLYQPDVAEVWQRLHEWAPQIMEFFSREYGQYPYEQVTVAQGGDGGMEYPMITLVTGRRSPPSLRGVTAHELAHMWYQGALGSNEADYAWLDEGFASYVTTEVTASIVGNPQPSHVGAIMNVLQAHHYDFFEPLNTPSDWFRTNIAYGISSYSGGEMVVDMLGYVISDSLRDHFLDAYFERFKFGHPDPYDVEKVAEDISGLRLDWYFHQFTETDWTLDYAVEDVESVRSGGMWQTEVILERESDIAMPVDLRLTLADGSEQWVTIPLGIMHGHKPVPDSWIVAKPWQWTFPRYMLTLDLPSRVTDAEIDPLLRTPDTNRLNNSANFPLDVTFLEAPRQSWTTYSVGWRPLAQYAYNWGFGAGLQARGTYYYNRLRTQAMVTLWPEVLFSGGDEPEPSLPGIPAGVPLTGDFSALDGVDFKLQFSTPQRLFGRYGTVSLQSRKHLGVLENSASLSTLLGRYDILEPGSTRLAVNVTHQARTTDRALFTPVSFGFPPSSLLSAGALYARTTSSTRVAVGVETGGSFSADLPFGSANRAFVDAAHVGSIGRFTEVFRAFIGTGSGSLSAVNLFRLGAATLEDRWGNDAYRNIGAVFEQPWDDPHWVAFSGPGPVAYMRREVGFSSGGSTAIGAPIGQHIAAGSARLLTDLPQSSALLRPLHVELFMGAGSVWNGDSFLKDFNATSLLFDFGFGLHYNVAGVSALRRWTAQSDVLSNLRIAARFPIWASDPNVIGDESQFGFRWLLGVLVEDPIWD